MFERARKIITEKNVYGRIDNKNIDYPEFPEST
jgi:hypothetical protein